MATSSLVTSTAINLTREAGGRPEEVIPLSGIPSANGYGFNVPKHWTLEARCIIVERRVCACGGTAEIPGSQLMLYYTKGTAHKYQAIKGDETIPYSLPRRAHYVDTTCNLCLECFHPHDVSQGFLDLEPAPPAEPTPSERRAAYADTLFDEL